VCVAGVRVGSDCGCRVVLRCGGVAVRGGCPVREVRRRRRRLSANRCVAVCVVVEVRCGRRRPTTGLVCGASATAEGSFTLQRLVIEPAFARVRLRNRGRRRPNVAIELSRGREVVRRRRLVAPAHGGENRCRARGRRVSASVFREAGEGGTEALESASSWATCLLMRWWRLLGPNTAAARSVTSREEQRAGDTRRRDESIHQD